MPDLLHDDFTDLAGWLPVASGLARLDVVRDVGPDGGSAMRLDFDFAGGGGFVVARKELALRLPETWALAFALRGAGPNNRLEVKLAAPGGENVWWYHEKAFELPARWEPMRIRSSQVEFAWGPAGGGAIAELGAIEIALAAGPGGRGSLWLADLRFVDRTVRAAPVVRAGSAQPGHGPEHLFAAAPATSWRSDGGAPQWLEVDFQDEREYGGLVLHWEDGRRARAFRVLTSNDGVVWRTAHTTTHADAARSWVYMPGTSARYLRLDLDDSAGDGFGLTRIEVRPFEFSRSLDSFFRAVAADQPRGDHPRWLAGEQSYWTPIGLADGDTCALIDEEGRVEVDRGTFSIEPFLFADGALVTWADATVSQALEDGRLPIPSSVWRIDGLVLRTTAFAARIDGRPVLFVRYRLEHDGPPRTVRLFVTCRPFQVTPPWQAFGTLGGTSPIHEIEGSAHGLRIDGARTVIALTPADGAGVATFDQGGVVAHLHGGDVPPRAHVADAFGFASGALRFDVALPASGAREVHLAIPFGTTDAALAAGTRGDAVLETVRREWRERLGQMTVRLPASRQVWADTMHTAVAHVLVLRDDAALQPGPRRYTRSWIRDGAIMAAALLRMGCAEEAREFVRWYAPHQKADGDVPCVVDRTGPDWLVEHDSHGELVFAVADCVRFGADRAFLDALWPAVQRAAGFLERLRDLRLVAEFDSPEKRAFRGLLPESASHEGYLAHPVHSYWDDFWAVRAFGDAAYLADLRGDAEEAARLLGLRDAMRTDVRASLEATIATRGLDYIPGSVEWADFDPTATSNAISLLGELPTMPSVAVARTYATYLAGFRARRDGEMPWKNYTAYEVRIVGALVCLGERAAANELASFLIGDRRPAAWNQWPEISWRDARSPGHIGDVPHAWIAAEWVLSFRTMLAFERPEDDALVVAAGVPAEWLDEDDVTVDGLATWWGTLGFTLRRVAGDAVEVALRGDVDPPGGIVLRPPLGGALVAVEIDGTPGAGFVADGVTVRRCPATVVLRWRR
ncbi:MAG TPA: discoidin domain-containing protein [Candidatus Binatia bacterium]|jgi:hypothetical protein|nr:discoidin domain-containing protein [Candidatus Binatia bacterium]